MYFSCNIMLIGTLNKNKHTLKEKKGNKNPSSNPNYVMKKWTGNCDYTAFASTLNSETVF